MLGHSNFTFAFLLGEYCICDMPYTKPVSFAVGEEVRLNKLGEGFEWTGGTNKPFKLDQCAGYSDTHLTLMKIKLFPLPE